MNNRGFTLIEAAIVVAIMAIMLAFAAPSLIDWRKNAQINEVARDVLSGLRQARSLAVTQGQDITASIDLVAHELTYNGITKSLSENVQLEANDDDNPSGAIDWTTAAPFTTTFRPQGSCTNWFNVRVNGDDELIIRIESTAIGLARL